MSASEKNNSSSEPHPSIWDVPIQMAGFIGRLADYARHDQLTGLLNKDAFRYEVSERIEQDKAFGVIFIDLDAFKKVNDKLGHEEGEELLERFGKYLQGKFHREGDAVAHEKLIEHPDSAKQESIGRYGGDEFGIVIDLEIRGTYDRRSQDYQDYEETMDRGMDYIRDVLDEFVTEQPPEIQACGFDVSAGYAVRKPGDSTSASDILRIADASMYQNKEAHKQQASRA